MGGVLSAPVELVRVQRHGSAAFRCAVAERQGWRSTHEDAHEMRCSEASGAFWVLDGHGGDGAALYSAPELVQEFAMSMDDKGNLPSDSRIVEGFASVDARLRTFVGQFPEKNSGSTVVGCLAAKQKDGTYTLKLVNCGDSRGIIVSGPTEEKEYAKLKKALPEHIVALTGDPESGPAKCDWPLIQESVDHKPSHPTEKARILAAGGHVTEDEPPRLDGNLAVSRGLGDFEYKADPSKPVAEQKCSAVPDIYEVSGVQPGALCVIACDGVWDVLTGDDVANLVRDWLKKDPGADLGEICSEIIRVCLAKNSRDNVTAMITHLVDGSDWAEQQDEMKNFQKLGQGEGLPGDEEVKKQYLGFLRKSKFPPEPIPCEVCERWVASMNQCPCKAVHYCTRGCQKKAWKEHKLNCSANPNAEKPSSPSKKASNKGNKGKK
jgi:serine/threonine protein phosphatase PrpC